MNARNIELNSSRRWSTEFVQRIEHTRYAFLRHNYARGTFENSIKCVDDDIYSMLQNQ